MFVFPLGTERERRKRKGRRNGEREKERGKHDYAKWFDSLEESKRSLVALKRLMNRVKMPPFSGPFKLL